MGKNKNKQQGTLTLEIVMCLGLLIVFMSGIFFLVWGNFRLIVATETHSKHLWLAAGDMEAARAEADHNFSNLMSQNNSTAIDARTTEVVLLTDYAKKIVTDSHPVDSGLSLFGARLEEVAIDVLGAEGRDTCALEFTGSWAMPLLKGNLDLGFANPSTDIDVLAGKAYVATNGSTASLADMFIVDVSNYDMPVKLSGLNSGPGINALQVVGKFVYAANSSINGQLQVIDITNPLAPVLMNNKQMPGVSGNTGIGKSLYYFSGKVLVGLAKTIGPELHIYDVSNPIAPVWQGSFETNTSVNDIYVNANTAYLTLAEGKQLLVLNITDPAHPVELGNFTPAGAFSQSGQSVAVLGKHAVLGRAAGLPAAGYKELVLLDLANLSTPISQTELDANLSFYSLFIRGGLAFAAANDASGEFKIYNLKNNLSLAGSANSSGQIVALDCEDEIFYAAQSGQPQLQIISR